MHLENFLPYNPPITSLHTYSKGAEDVNAKSYTWMLIVALLVIIKAWKQPRCPSVSERIYCGTSNSVLHSTKKKKIKTKNKKTHEDMEETYVLFKLKCLSTVSFQLYDILEMVKV